MKISIIIPTLNRPDDLRACLEAIKLNSRQPDEVIIVDQGDSAITEEILKKYGFASQIIVQLEKSLTKARNNGVDKAIGNIVIFVDDDVVIATDYLSVTEEYFSKKVNEDVLGIVGKDMVQVSKAKTFTSRSRQLLGIFFWRGTFNNSSVVLRSGHNVLRNNGNTEQEVQWTSGATNCWRREVFKDNSFDERMIRWCFGEDVSFSYQIYQKNPGSLRYIPNLVYHHNVSTSERLLNEQALKMTIIYRYFFWHEYVKDGSVVTRLAYVWSQVGYSTMTLVEYKSVKTISTLISSYLFLLHNDNKIIKEDVNYNTFILD